MFTINRLGTALAGFALALMLSQPAATKPRKAQKLVEQGRVAEDNKDYDKALELYEQAVMENPRDASALLSLRRMRFQAGQAHVDKGQKLRAEGKLEDALSEFRKAYAIDPSSSIAEQETRRTRQMIEREKREGEKLKGEERGMTPVERARKEVEERVASVLPAPELKPISTAPITLRMNNQPPRVLFETVGKLAGINVIMDPDQAGGMGMGGPQRNLSVELSNARLEEALDYLAVLTKSFWKPLSPNTILVAQDNPTKRRDFEDLVVKVFYLTNITVAQDLNEIAAAVRGITDIRRLYTCAAQNAIIVRGTVDQVGLAEKLIQDMDKPKAEVVVEVLVMEASRNKTRDLASTLTSGSTSGLSSAVSFTPNGASTTSTDTTTAATSSLMSLSRVGKLSTNDFSITMPGALIKALMTDSRTRVLQQPQVRAADGQKASLRIGEKQPIASGSFSSGMSTATGLLASTQFQFIDVGVNVDMTPKIHGPDEVSLHIELEISTVKDRIEIGGVSQPILGQRKVVHDIRIREGEVNVLGGLMQGQQSRTLAGMPGLTSIPGLKWLLSSRSNTDNDSELLIALIPHIVRAPEINDVNLKGVAAGTDQSIRLNYAPRKTVAPAEPAKPAPATSPVPETKPAAPQAPLLSPTGTVLPLPVGAGPPKLTFTPAATEVQMGGTVMVRLEIANGVDMFAAPFKLKFDSKVLRLKEVSDGGIIGGDGRKPIFLRNIRNDVGEASVVVNRLPGSGGVSGTGSLAMLEFQVVGRGPAKIWVQEFGLKDSKMQPITVALPEVTLNAR